MSMVLVWRRDGEPEESEQRFEGVQLLIGRLPSNGLVLDEPSVSRHHAGLMIRSGAIELRDMSSNGTFVNGSPIVRTRLSAGDLIRIGDFTVRVVAWEEEEEHLQAATLAPRGLPRDPGDQK
jgi:pSer/pThr/pTyr-binding forkhead associated (FHA) protein